MIGIPRQLESEFDSGLRKKVHLSLAPPSFPGNILRVLRGWKGFDPEMILSLFSVNFRLTVRQARQSEHNIVQVGPPVQTRGTSFVSLRLRCAPLRATPSITSHRSGPYPEQIPSARNRGPSRGVGNDQGMAFRVIAVPSGSL
jgi:hypothetical protein